MTLAYPADNPSSCPGGLGSPALRALPDRVAVNLGGLHPVQTLRAVGGVERERVPIHPQLPLTLQIIHAPDATR